MWKIIEQVVDFPLLPVTIIDFFTLLLKKNKSKSVIILFLFFLSVILNFDLLILIPGLKIIKSTKSR